MNKVIVFGGNGFVGKNIQKHLQSKNFLFPLKNEVDLLSKTQTLNYLNKIKPDLIINLAGKVGGIQKNINNQYEFLILNSLINLNLISASTECKVPKFLNISSSCIYPPNIDRPIKETDLLKSGVEKTNEGYALAKILALKACEIYENESYKTLVPCNLYGPYDNFDLINGHMIPSVIHKTYLAKLNDNNVTIWGDGKARREFMYVEDFIDFLFFAIDNFNKIPKILNVGIGKDYSIFDYYKEIANTIGYNGDFLFDTNKPIGMKRKLIDNEIIKALGWKPKHDLKMGIKKTYKYFINYEI